MLPATSGLRLFTKALGNICVCNAWINEYIGERDKIPLRMQLFKEEYGIIRKSFQALSHTLLKISSPDLG